MNETQRRIENRLLDSIIECQAYLSLRQIRFDKVYDPDFIRYPNLAEMLTGYTNLKTLVKLVKDEEGKDLLCGGKRP